VPGNTYSFALLLLFCASAVCFDLARRRIPNLLNAGGLLAGLLLGGCCSGVRGFAASAAGALVGFSVLLVPFILRMVGAGDVKFLAAAGALVGMRALWASFLAGAAIAGLLALLLLLRRERCLPRLKQRIVLLHAGLLRTPREMRGQRPDPAHDVRLPYAVPLSLGLVIISSVKLFA
jgi:prepilin peptidase CpaA